MTAVAQRELVPGEVVAGRYRVSRELGHGGTGKIFEAVHEPTGRAVALKTILPGLANLDDVVARFQREAMAANLLDHPNIIEMLDLGQHEGRVFMVMELVRGRSLRDALGEGALGVRRSLVLARQIVEALSHANARGLVHRDLKPENIMLTLRGEPGQEYEHVKLLDFGMVKLIGDAADALGNVELTARGVVFGTPAYMAPEQALGKPVDGRADLYAMGAILFEMLTGQRPFEAKDPVELMRKHVGAPAPTLASVVGAQAWVTPALEVLLAGALTKKAEQRYLHGSAMIAALDEAFASLNHLPAGI